MSNAEASINNLKQEYFHNEHGVKRRDDYFWMKNRDSREVLDFLNSENKIVEEYFSDDQDKIDLLFSEIVDRIDKEDQSVPYLKEGYFYYSRFEKGGEYPIFCRKRESLDSEEQILLDVNLLAEGKEYCQVGKVSILKDNSKVIFSADYVSRRQYNLYSKDVASGEITELNLVNGTGGFAIANDDDTIFYAQKDESLRPHKIIRSSIKNSTNKEVVFEEVDDTFITYVYKSKSGQHIMIGSQSTDQTEYQIIDANNPAQAPKIFTPRSDRHEYSVYDSETEFYILTNKNAQNFKVMKCAKNTTNVEHWVDFVPHRESILVQDLELLKEYAILEIRETGLVRFEVHNLTSGDVFEIPFKDEAYSAFLGTNLEFNTSVLRYGYTSMSTPATVYDFDLETKTQELKKQQKVLTAYNPEDYVVQRVHASSRDGKEIPMSIIYHKDVVLNGENPTLQYAYGSYGSIIDAGFSYGRLSLLKRGFVFAISHIRGGEDLGRSWYEDGKLLNKNNTFNDFIDCSKYLIAKKYTNPNKLFAMGGSAGGMLMGVIANWAPELYKGIVAQVPFVDVVTTMLDDTIPLTTGEYTEWGNPNDKEYFDYMLAYSPYDNVSAQDYPAMLVTTGYHDSQVQYWEPAKWVAKLRELKTDENPLLFKTEMNFGHGGSAGRYEAFKEVALEYVFLLKLAGISI